MFSGKNPAHRTMQQSAMLSGEGSVSHGNLPGSHPVPDPSLLWAKKKGQPSLTALTISPVLLLALPESGLEFLLPVSYPTLGCVALRKVVYE